MYLEGGRISLSTLVALRPAALIPLLPAWHRHSRHSLRCPLQFARPSLAIVARLHCACMRGSLILFPTPGGVPALCRIWRLRRHLTGGLAGKVQDIGTGAIPISKGMLRVLMLDLPHNKESISVRESLLDPTPVPWSRAYLGLNRTVLRLIRDNSVNTSTHIWELGTLAEALTESEWPRLTPFMSNSIFSPPRLSWYENVYDVLSIAETHQKIVQKLFDFPTCPSK
ncbi:hypothetical protein V8E52_001995 [Russula decolorans]